MLDMTVTHFWINDELVPIVDAKVSVLDHGFTVADGVFETLLVSDGKVFALDRHLARLAKSAFGLGISMPDSVKISNGITQVLQKNPNVDFGRLRITVTSGAGPLGSDRTSAEPTLVISLAEQATWPATTKVLLVPWTRNENSPLAGLKTTSYAENVYALDAAKSQGFSEAVFCDTSSRLCEGTGSNIFLVKGDQIFTPSDASGLLRGITRDLVIEWATDSGFVIVERDVDPSELWDADEVFITSSTRNVHPVSELAKLDSSGTVVDRRTLDPGLVTEKLGNIFLTQRAEKLNP
jgi:branched-chain amino acid aminotransferase